MFVWHREELLVTLSTEYYLRVRALLQQNGIKMQCRQAGIRDHGKKQNMLQKPLAQYYIYVHEDDLERAAQLVQQMGPEESITVNYLEW
ncbi:MAG: hypothetical protein IKU46_04685 [Peptococcaceae bacterium]|nr:hypothetical protein [Peptococcaceae bacterium]